MLHLCQGSTRDQGCKALDRHPSTTVVQPRSASPSRLLHAGLALSAHAALVDAGLGQTVVHVLRQPTAPTQACLTRGPTPRKRANGSRKSRRPAQGRQPARTRVRGPAPAPRWPQREQRAVAKAVPCAYTPTPRVHERPTTQDACVSWTMSATSVVGEHTEVDVARWPRCLPGCGGGAMCRPSAHHASGGTGGLPACPCPDARGAEGVAPHHCGWYQ